MKAERGYFNTDLKGDVHWVASEEGAWLLHPVDGLKPVRSMKGKLTLSSAEIQSGLSRVDWAEGLILQLRKEHEGRNSWLLNYGKKEEAVNLRHQKGLTFDEETESCETINLNTIGG
jgi:hypothetical protein